MKDEQYEPLILQNIQIVQSNNLISANMQQKMHKINQNKNENNAYLNEILNYKDVKFDQQINMINDLNNNEASNNLNNIGDQTQIQEYDPLKILLSYIEMSDVEYEISIMEQQNSYKINSQENKNISQQQLINDDNNENCNKSNFSQKSSPQKKMKQTESEYKNRMIYDKQSQWLKMKQERLFQQRIHNIEQSVQSQKKPKKIFQIENDILFEQKGMEEFLKRKLKAFKLKEEKEQILNKYNCGNSHIENRITIPQQFNFHKKNQLQFQSEDQTKNNEMRKILNRPDEIFQIQINSQIKYEQAKLHLSSQLRKIDIDYF